MTVFDDDAVGPPSDDITTPLDEMTRDNVSAEDYSTQGKTTVATRRGYRFVPSDKDLPVITHEGINVTAEQADALEEESDGLVRRVKSSDDKEGE